ncbi:hypothetical protein DQ239_07945 [Blastococcus sp. TF02-09]|nr:hypothetical protein DQ239_07945 [Blastococcus sp. TF02-9]
MSLLGARLVVQHGLLFARPSPSLLRAATVLDVVHAASMLPLLPDTRYRRAAGTSGGVAAVSAAVTAVMGLRGIGGPTGGTGRGLSPV